MPVGAYLSGGLDSSLIVAMMAQNSNQPIKTFSVGLENSQYNELGYAKAVADLFKTDHHEFVISPKDFRDSLSSGRSFSRCAFIRNGRYTDAANVTSGEKGCQRRVDWRRMRRVIWRIS